MCVCVGGGVTGRKREKSNIVQSIFNGIQSSHITKTNKMSRTKIHITQHTKNQENLTKSPGMRQSRDDNPEMTQMWELVDTGSAAAVLIILHEVKLHSLEMNGKIEVLAEKDKL